MSVHLIALLLLFQTSLVGRFQEGMQLLREGNLPDAESCFNAVLAEKPDYASARKAIAAIRVKQKRLDEAIRILEEIRAGNGHDLDTRLTLAELYSWTRHYDRSIVEYNEVMAADTLNVAALKGLGKVLRWATRYTESEQAYNSVLAAEPFDVEALTGLALTFAQEKRMDKALTLVDRALHSSPGNLEILHTKADILAWSNRYQESEAVYQSLLERTPRKAQIYHALGDLNEWQGRTAKAVEALRKASQLEPSNVGHLVALGRVALEAGLHDEAYEAVQRIFSIDPGNQQAFELLRRLEAAQSMDYARIVDGYIEPFAMVGILLAIAIYFRRRMDILKRRHFYYWVVTYPIIPGILVTYVLFFIASRLGALPLGVVKGVVEVTVFFLLMMAFVSLLWVSRTRQANTKKAVLAVGAHPDDIELGCGGALAKFKDSGYRVCAIVMTSGEQGNIYQGKDRRDEAKNGAATLGLDELWVFNFKDTQLPTQLDEIKGIIEEKILATGADIVITQSPNDIHQDHKAVFEATKIAARGPRTLLCYEDVSTEPHFVPNYFVDITEYMEDKLDAVEAHKTQRHRLYMDPESIRGRASHRGMQSGVKYAEAFTMYKGVDVCPL